MEGFYTILIIPMGVLSGFFFFEARRIDHQESSLQEELTWLPAAADGNSAQAASSPAKADAFDQGRFIAHFRKLNDSSLHQSAEP